jgi:hypothetical protein
MTDNKYFVILLERNKDIRSCHVYIFQILYKPMFNIFHFNRRSKVYFICKHSLTIALVLCTFAYIFLKIELLIDYRDAHVFHELQQTNTCETNINQDQEKPKVILFWTKIFSAHIDEDYINKYFFTPSGRCVTDRCKVSNNREVLCASHAVIFHARGGIKMYDMPKTRLPHQRYVLLTKEPPYKTTAIVGHLDYFFNWTATVSDD